MSDDDFVEATGGADSEPALEPGDAAPDDSPADSFDGGSDHVGRARIPRTDASRQAMADAIAKFKSERETDGDDDVGDFGVYDEGAKPTPKKVTPAAAPTPGAADAIGHAQPPTPPAPSLDPEVGRLRTALAADRETLAKERAAFESERDVSRGVVDHEQYLESAPKAYRGWLESMRGAKLTDDEYRQEAADFVTLMSSDVLGVKLPDEVRSRIEAQLARKAISAYRAKDTRRQMAETSKREAERVEAEWRSAAQALDGQFRVEATAKEYSWLATEDSPGSIVVDVIQSAQRRDGTVLSWQEASKQANDYLKKQASRYIDKRKHLLSAAPTEKSVGDAAKAQDGRTGRPPGSSQVTRPPEPIAPSTEAPVVSRHKPGSTWDKEAHRRATRAAFAPVFKPEE